MRFLAKRFALPFAVTTAALIAAMHLGIARVGAATAEAQSSCPNSECHGYAMCRYTPNVSCSLHGRLGPCLAERC